jgi:hypothetical protein
MNRMYKWGTGTGGACKKEDEMLFPVSYVSYDEKYDHTVMHDTVTPNFNKRIRAGELILNPMSKVRTIVEIPSGASSSIDRYDSSVNTCYAQTHRHLGPANISFYHLDRGLGPEELPLLEPTVDSDEQLLTAAVSGVDPTSYSVMEDVLQLRQFMESILHPIRGMKRVTDQMRSHNQRTRSLGAAGAWAKYRFEFLPLLGTAEALIRTALDPAKGLKKDVRLRSTATSGGNDHKAGSVQYSNGMTWTHDLTEVVRKRAVVFYKLHSDHNGLSQSLGTRFKDLPTGMWNVVPYSFIIDRVINISQFLTAVTNLCDPSISFEGACITTKRYNRSLLQVTRRDFSTSYGMVFDGKPMISVVDSTQRVLYDPYVALSPLNLDFKPLDLVKNMTYATDLLALIVLGLKGKR